MQNHNLSMVNMSIKPLANNNVYKNIMLLLLTTIKGNVEALVGLEPSTLSVFLGQVVVISHCSGQVLIVSQQQLDPFPNHRCRHHFLLLLRLSGFSGFVLGQCSTFTSINQSLEIIVIPKLCGVVFVYCCAVYLYSWWFLLNSWCLLQTFPVQQPILAG